MPQSSVTPCHFLEQFILEERHDKLFLVDPSSGSIFNLNPMAGLFVELIQSGMQRDEIIQSIASQLSISDQEVASDMDNLLDTISSGCQPRNDFFPDTMPVEAFTSTSLDQPAENQIHRDDILRKTPLQTKNYRINSKCFRISCPDDAIFRLVHSQLQMMAVEPQTDAIHIEIEKGSNGFAIYVDGEIIQATYSASWLDILLIQLLIDESCRNECEWVSLHAAALANKTGQTVLFAAPSGSGKSTLAVNLALDGFTYLGDDTVIVDTEKRTVIPFPTAANLKPGSWEVFIDSIPELAQSEVFRENTRPVKFAALPEHQNRKPPDNVIHGLIFPRYQHDSTGLMRKLAASETWSRLNSARVYIHSEMAGHVYRDLIDLIESLPSYYLEYSSYRQAKSLINRLLSSQ